MRTRMWVFKYSSTRMYAAFDGSSGGYPYPTDSFTQAHIWTDYDKAKNYQRMFPELELFELAISLEKSE